MPKRGLTPARRRDDARETSQVRQQLRRGVDERLRPIGIELVLQFADFALLERLDHEQAVDEKAITLRRRHAARRRMRTRDEAHFFEIRHHVADRRRGQFEPRLPRQHPRADRLAVGNVALDQRLQQMLRAGVKHESPFYALIAAMSASVRAFPTIALVGRHATPGIAEPLGRLAAFLVARGHRGVDRCGDREVHAASRATPRRRRSSSRAQPISRSSSAATVPCSRSRASSRRRCAADRHQSGSARLPDRHRAVPTWNACSPRCSTATMSRKRGRCLTRR